MATTAALTAEVEPRGGRAGLRAPRAPGRVPRRLRGQRAPQGLAAGHHARGQDRSRFPARAARPEAGLPVEPDTIWRIYSMTKPITSVAAMMLYEEGALRCSTRWRSSSRLSATCACTARGMAAAPVRSGRRADARVAPAHAHVRAHLRLPAGQPGRRGLSRGGLHPGPAARARPRLRVRLWAGLPLLFEPGAEWNYSVSTDVVGRIVEIVSGQSLDEFFAERIFAPLGMTDTGFTVSDAERAAHDRAVHPRPRDGDRRRLSGGSTRSRPSARSCSPAATAWPRPPPTTTASRRCCCAAASSTACACSRRGPSTS